MLYLERKNFSVPLSRLGFGGMRFDDFDEGVKAVRLAYEKGITYFDTAPGYCGDTSEAIFGEAFTTIPRDKIIISSKSGVWQDKTAEKLLKRVKKSIERMDVGYLDILHIWCVNNEKNWGKIMSPGGPFEGAEEAKKQGLVKHIFFSTHADNDLNKRIIAGKHFEGMTVGFNLLNYAARLPTVEAARDADLITVSMNPLAGGILPKYKDLFGFLSTPTSSIVETALFFNLSNPNLDVVLCGMGTSQEVEENIAIVNGFKKMGDNNRSLAKQIEENLADLNGSFCTLCNYCLPCPEGIPIPAYMNIIDVKHSTGEENQKSLYYWHKDRNTFLGIEADRCTECGACEKACTQHLPIIDRLKEVSEDFPRDTIK